MSPLHRWSGALGWLIAAALPCACGGAPSAPSAATGPPVATSDGATAMASAPPPTDAASTPGAATAAEESAAPPPTDAAPSTLPPHRCSQDPTAEAPVRSDELGAGDRVIHVRNAAHEELQIRLLGADEQPAIEGTLRIEPGERATFRVPAGTYWLRYRLQSTCEVLRGSKIVLTGPRAGVEIALKPGGKASQPGVRRVVERL